MRTAITKGLGIAAMATGLAFAGAASADPINIQFNINAGGPFACDTGNLATATTCNTGAPNTVAFVQTSNIGLVSGTSILFSPIDLPLVAGGTFSKIFDVAGVGTFTETLTVLGVVRPSNALGMLASGMISCSGTCMFGGVSLDPTAVFFSVAYTQNAGPGTQINGSFNNSTTPPNRTPEPGTLALLGLGLAGLGFARRRKQ